MADLAEARSNMVESQVRPSDVTDLRIHDAMRVIRREDFVPAGKSFLAYTDVAVEYAPGRPLLKPRDVAKLLQMVKPVAGERALAIAAPYAAAILETMEVVVDRLDEGDLKTVPGANYDLIVVEGAVTRAPEAWLKALAPGGRLAVVEREGPVGKACLYVRAGGEIGRRAVFDATPPLLAGFEAQHGFAF